MKKLSIFLIHFYKNFVSIIVKSIVGSPDVCRFQETCSEYTERMIKEKGAVRGIVLGVVRILKCQPLYNVTI